MSFSVRQLTSQWTGQDRQNLVSSLAGDEEDRPCIAATHDRQRFRTMNGQASKA
jgi:hypothetical protein